MFRNYWAALSMFFSLFLNRFKFSTGQNSQGGGIACLGSHHYHCPLMNEIIISSYDLFCISELHSLTLIIFISEVIHSMRTYLLPLFNTYKKPYIHFCFTSFKILCNELLDYWLENCVYPCVLRQSSLSFTSSNILQYVFIDTSLNPSAFLATHNLLN